MLIFYRSAKNRQVTHHSYALSYFLHELVSERIERGANMKRYLLEEFGMESLKFKETNDEFKGENNDYY
jgi:hypothetical protein